MKTTLFSIKIIGLISVVLVLTGAILKLCEIKIAVANTVLLFGIAFGISVFIYGIFCKR